MKSTLKSTKRGGSNLRNVLAFMLALTLAACSSPVEPIEDEDPIVEEPTTTKYSVVMDFKRISILGDCDADPLGVKNNGEFSYQVSYSIQRPDGTWSGKNVVKQTQRYGESGGDRESKTDKGGVFTISKKATVTLDDGLNYRMHVSAIEWDSAIKDADMNGRTATEENSAGGSKLTYKHELDLGNKNSCKVRLFVNANETAVQT